MKRIGNESDDPDDPAGGAFADFLRLQAEFQSRLADETMRYLRRLQAAVGPWAPGTVVVPDPGGELHAAGVPGDSVALSLGIENHQEVHCVVTPALTPLMQASGAMWLPDAEPSPPSALLGPGHTTELRVTVALPADLPTGTWRGALLLHGFRGEGVPVRVEVVPAGADAADRATEAADSPTDAADSPTAAAATTDAADAGAGEQEPPRREAVP